MAEHETIDLRLRSIVRAAAVALVAIVAAAAALWPVALAGRVPAYGDNISFWAPNTHFWTNEIRCGRFPFWNPYILCGVPYAADINHGLFYPPNWILLLCDSAAGLRLLVIGHVAIGIAGMYLFARSQRLTARIATWAGVAFGLSEMFLPLSNHVVMMESMSWLGFALCLAVRIGEGGGVRTAGLLSGVLALSALAGDVHATYMIGLACGVVLVCAAASRATRGQFGGAGVIVALSAASAAGALMLAAVALAPAAQLMLLTQRGAGAASYAGYHSLDSKSLMGILLPNIWGSARDGNVWNFRSSDAVFIGLVSLALAVQSMRRPLDVLMPAILVLVGLCLSLGEYGFAWGALRAVVPGFKVFRQPREYFIIAAVGVIILAARGLQDIYEARKGGGGGVWKWFLGVSIAAVAGCGAIIILRAGIVPRMSAVLEPRYGAAAGEISRVLLWSGGKAALVAALAGAAACVWRLGGLSGRSAAMIIGAAIVVEYAVTSWGTAVFGPADLCRGRSDLADQVKAETAGAYVRIAPEAKGFGEYFEAYSTRHMGNALVGEPADLPTLGLVKSCLVDNEPMYSELRSVLGYSTFITKRYGALWDAAGGTEASPVRLRATKGADYGLLGATVAIEASDKWDECKLKPTEKPGDIEILYAWTAVDSFEDAQRMLAGARERGRVIPVVEGISLALPGAGAAGTPHSVEDIRRGTNSLALTAFTDGPGLLYVPECNYPGWKAYDNGAEVPIYAANIAFRAIYLTAGKHEVEFCFEPSALYWGAAVSAGSLIALMFLLTAPRRKGGAD